MYTDPTLTKSQLKEPPVWDCFCTYCETKRQYPHWQGAIYPKLPKGNEAHNPENLNREVLKGQIPQELFNDYIEKGYFTFQGKSGLWYRLGFDMANTIGQSVWIQVFFENVKFELVAGLCLHPTEMYSPTCLWVLQQYISLTTDEGGTWDSVRHGHVYMPSRLEFHNRLNKYMEKMGVGWIQLQ